MGSGGGAVSGGLVGSGGVIPTGGVARTGGEVVSGGVAGTAGTADSVAAGGAAGTTFDPAQPPCDIYAADGGPCVAAHSTVRRLLSTYNGPLYQVRIGGSNAGTGGVIQDIGFVAATGLADSAAQDAACGSSSCTISRIYDQSGNENDLTHTPAGGGEKQSADNEANATAVYLTARAQKLYGVHIVAGVGYRSIAAIGTAIGDNPETEYMVVDATYFNGACCFEYGNMETSIQDDGEGAAEAVYFGNCVIWNEGGGNGPWVMADLQNGLWAGDSSPYGGNPTSPSSWLLVTGMVKADQAGTHHWTIKEGNAQSSTLNKVFDRQRPGGAGGKYWTMRKEGAIGLGTAGDNSDGGTGNFYEGIMTAQYSSDAADTAVQANIASVYSLATHAPP
ncbi:MAG: arabinofuranosidase catalytic domain-containing protein [Polyangia bacterium]